VPTSRHVRVSASALAATIEARSGAKESTLSRDHVSMANTVVVVTDRLPGSLSAHVVAQVGGLPESQNRLDHADRRH
jgi:hypothetical protein